MTRSRTKRIDPFHHPDNGQVDYERLIAALRECREQVEHLRTHTGIRNPVYREAEALIAQVDAVAALSRVPDAVQRVSKRPRGHSTSDFGEV
jgi:hypothetical protein